MIWFKDARNSILNLVRDYGLAGIVVWNIMNYYYQTWLVIDSQADIQSYLQIKADQIDQYKLSDQARFTISRK
jgi:hypothetical protein